ncbi:GNAT family N-acetyltransferase [Streptomyces sp. NPDC050161]|uniref:GNAT family N-acetyltransferase n=1 Tax=Streptomyces sp. NPDC050161 TaxID=3365604 RepID=UPI0037A46F50
MPDFTDTLQLAWTLAAEPSRSPDAMALLRAYYTETSDRYHELHERRRSTSEEIEQGLAEYPSDSLAPPHGVLLVARYGGVAAGCAGVRLLDARTAELKQMYVRPARRGLGAAARLLTAAEQAAAGLGAERIRLDSRLDLVEAVALYRRHGYREIAPYHGGPYVDVFFEKRIPRPRPLITSPDPAGAGHRAGRRPKPRCAPLHHPPH